MRLPGRCAHRLGRRGAFLILVGAVWILRGWDLLVEPSDGELLHQVVLSSAARGGAWIVTGTVAVLAAVRSTGRDGLGFVALVVMPAVLLASHAWAGVQEALGEPVAGATWSGVVRWAAVIAVVLIVAGWPEPPTADGARARRRP